MADIRKVILKNSGIDIAEEENIFRIYQIRSADISDRELEEKIQAARRRWNANRNSPDDQIAERSKRRLEKAEAYEKLLRDRSTRRELYGYYGGTGADSGPQQDAEISERARTFFAMVGATARPGEEELEFFTEYYRLRGRDKTAVRELLINEFGMEETAHGRGAPRSGQSHGADGGSAADGSGSSGTVSGREGWFSRATILGIGGLTADYEAAGKSAEVRLKYPDIQKSLYDLLDIDTVKTAYELRSALSEKSRAVYTLRQEKGAEYLPLVDLFNSLSDMAYGADVAAHIEEFKLLLRFPGLTPYMYAFGRMDLNTLKRFSDMACKEYGFRDRKDFLNRYYIKLDGAFGIDNTAVRRILDKALWREEPGEGSRAAGGASSGEKAYRRGDDHERNSKYGEGLEDYRHNDDYDDRDGYEGYDGAPDGDMDENVLSAGALIVYFLAYLPLCISCAVFKILRIFFAALSFMAFPVGAGVFLWTNFCLPRMLSGVFPGLEGVNIFSLAEIFSNQSSFSGAQGPGAGAGTGASSFAAAGAAGTIVRVLAVLAVFLLPAVLAFLIVRLVFGGINRRLDLKGRVMECEERLDETWDRAEEDYLRDSSAYYRSRAVRAVINAFCIAVLAAVIIIAGSMLVSAAGGALGIHNGSGAAGYEQSAPYGSGMRDDGEGTTPGNPGGSGTGVIMEITADMANIRQGPGTQYSVVSQASMGTEFAATGNTSTTAGGSTWYEIYLDQDTGETGWASGVVIAFK